MTVGRPHAVVIGDLDLIRPVRMAGAEVTAVLGADAPARRSNQVSSSIDLPDPFDAEVLVERLVANARGDATPLFYQGDEELLAIGRHRDRLRQAGYRFVLPSPGLLDDLVDKSRFQRLAEELGLPIPRAQVVDAHDPNLFLLEGDAIVKPLNRTSEWSSGGIATKAVSVADQDEFADFASRVERWFPELLVQQMIPGDEDRIESYHVYVDDEGAIAGEFTGRKIRTIPRRFGFTTALEITNQPDVLSLGRHVVRATGLRGVAKVDLKRDREERLRLLEINPRFNLWHLAGAVAGVNLPGLVFADLTGAPRPAAAVARPGVRWSNPLADLRSVRDDDRTSLWQWLRWTAGCDTFHDLSVRDPQPFLHGSLLPMVRRRLSRRA
ncbi:MAG: ATP-grasp domain-containing protein [Acidimicrobiales bacterium]